MKQVLVVGGGVPGGAEVKPQDKEALAEGLLQDDLLVLLVTNSFKLPFEAKRDLSIVFGQLFRATEAAPAFRDAVVNNGPLLDFIVGGFRPAHAEIMLLCTDMLLECIREEAIARWMLQGEHAFKILECTIPVVRDVIKGYRCPSRSSLKTHGGRRRIYDRQLRRILSKSERNDCSQGVCCSEADAQVPQ